MIITLENKKNKNLILINDISSISKINYDDLICTINKFNIEVVSLYSKKYIHKYELEKIMSNYGFYSIKKLSRITDIVPSTLYSNFENANILNLFRGIELDNTLYLTIKAIEETLKEYSKKYISTLSLDEIEKERVKLLPGELPKTLELAINFIHYKKNNYKKAYGEDTSNFTRLINSIEKFIFYLKKEVFNCNSDYILNIISDKEKIKSGYVGIICQFLNFVKRKLKSNCRFTKQFGKSVIEQYVIDKGEKIDNRIYDKETWSKYYLILKDIDRHIENAICDSRYSQCWLYCILNLSVTWRKKNIILSVPRINLQEVGIYTFEWFNEENKFSLDMANSVLEQIKFSLDGVIAYKNKKNLHFNIPLSLKIPTTIALIISEIHCRNNNEELIFYDLNKSDIRKSDYKKIFEDDELLDFQNLKCSRSIITYGYSYAINNIGIAPVAYDIYRRGRSHTNYDQRINNVTGDHYLALDNLENGPKEYMYNIIERGAFGFVYYKLFQCIIEKEKFDSLNQDDITELTKFCTENVNAISLENIANSFIEYSDINKINVFELLWYNSLNKNLKNKANKYEFINKMIDVYKVRANEILGECDKFSEFIEYKYRDVDETLNLLTEENFDMKNILIRISNGESSCYTEYTNCIFDRLERYEKCPYNYGEKGGSSCIGCKYNLLTVYALNEVSDRLKRLLNKIDNNDSVTDDEIIKNSHIIKNYLSIIIEASIHFNEKEFINNMVDLSEIKKKIIYLKNKNKIINF